MRPAGSTKDQLGFSLIELMVALAMFLLITGAAFTLLSSSQQRYQTDSQVLTSFQEARLGMDQIVRDINDAGYPPPSFVGTDPTKFTTAPFGWSPVPSPCTVDIACITPGNFDLIIETNPNPQDAGSQVQWIRYSLQGTTLMRGMIQKTAGHDPAVDTAPNLAPFVQNVVNNSPSLQVGQDSVGNPVLLSGVYPAIFPAGNSVPLFTYICDTPINPLPPPTRCSAAVGADNSPANIRDVIITLVVASPVPDATTGHPRLVQLNGRARRVNPNQ